MLFQAVDAPVEKIGFHIAADMGNMYAGESAHILEKGGKSAACRPAAIRKDTERVGPAHHARLIPDVEINIIVYVSCDPVVDHFDLLKIVLIIRCQIIYQQRQIRLRGSIQMVQNFRRDRFSNFPGIHNPYLVDIQVCLYVSGNHTPGAAFEQ